MTQQSPNMQRDSQPGGATGQQRLHSVGRVSCLLPDRLKIQFTVLMLSKGHLCSLVAELEAYNSVCLSACLRVLFSVVTSVNEQKKEKFDNSFTAFARSVRFPPGFLSWLT